jgi:UDP-glucose 4-epimerase
MPKVLVTGGAGFIGSHVADVFLDKGWEVTIVDDLTSGKKENVPAAAEFHRVSVTSPELARMVTQTRFDVVTHLAAQIDVRKSVADPVTDATINILGTLNLMEALRAGHASTRVIFTSTGGALYGDFNTPPNIETYPKDPESPYAISKLSAEYYLAYFGRVHNMDAGAVRFANVYGPRQDPHGEAGVVAIFCQRLLDSRPITVYGNGTQTRDYVFVKDVARANVIASTVKLPDVKRLDDRAINIGTGVETSVLDLAESLQRAAMVSVPIDFAPKRDGEQQRSAIKNDKAQRILGWKPAVKLEEGLAQTYAFFKTP